MALVSKLFRWLATVNSRKLTGHFPTGQDSPVPSGDVTAPTVPANPTNAGITQTTIALTCDDATDAVGVAGYQWKRDSTELTAGVNKSIVDTGLTANTTYAYSVRAYDAAGNYSAYSSPVNIQTLPQSLIEWTSGLDTFLKFTIGTEFNLNLSSICSSTLGAVSFSKLSGNWLTDISLVGTTITGTPSAVETQSVVIRATDGLNIADMAFTLESLNADTTPPPAPTSFTATATGPTTCRLTWVNATDVEVAGARTSGYLGVDIYMDGAKIDRASGGATEYIVGQTNPDISIAAGSSHDWKARSVDNAFKKGAFTPTITVVQPTTSTPGMVPNLVATASGQTQINVSWGEPTSGAVVTTYSLEESSDGATWAEVQNQLSPRTFSRTGLSGGDNRRYRVTAYASAVAGPVSSVVSATTAPSELTITTFHYDDMEGSAFDYKKSGEAGYSAARWSGVDDFHTSLDTAPALSANRARFGSKSVRFQLTNPYPDTSKKISNGTEWPHRNQAKAKAWPTTSYSGNAIIGQEWWYAGSVYLPAAGDAFGDDEYIAAAAGSGWEIMLQWHDSPDPGTGEISRQPMVNLTMDRAIGQTSPETIAHTRWGLNIKCQDAAVMTSNAFDRNDWIDLGPFAADKGHWTDWVFRIKWDYRNVGPGLLEVWKNGTKVYSEIGRGNCYNDVTGPSFDIGIYCGWRADAAASVAPDQRVFYWDELKVIRVVGNPQAAVDTSNAAYIAVAPRGVRT